MSAIPAVVQPTTAAAAAATTVAVAATAAVAAAVAATVAAVMPQLPHQQLHLPSQSQRSVPLCQNRSVHLSMTLINSNPNPNPSPQSKAIPRTAMHDHTTMTVPELRKRCKELSLRTLGRKAELQEWIGTLPLPVPQPLSVLRIALMTLAACVIVTMVSALPLTAS